MKKLLLLFVMLTLFLVSCTTEIPTEEVVEQTHQYEVPVFTDSASTLYATKLGRNGLSQHWYGIGKKELLIVYSVHNGGGGSLSAALRYDKTMLRYQLTIPLLYENNLLYAVIRVHDSTVYIDRLDTKAYSVITIHVL